MKKWAFVVIAFYFLLVAALFLPSALFFDLGLFPNSYDGGSAIHWTVFIWAGALVLGEGLLLWLSVDTTRRRLKPRSHILVSVVTAALFMAILTVGIVLCFTMSVWGDRGFPDRTTLIGVLSAFGIPWLVWGILFYRFWRNASDPVTRAVAWLLRGSVLELLVAVPAHVITRRRHDCCAPVFTGIGITAGIAIMLLSFGPSVLLLFKKRIERYPTREPSPQ
jgi:hypothetical protein